MTETINITIWIKTDRVGSTEEMTMEVAVEDWVEMSETEQQDMCRDEAFNMAEWGYDIEE